MKTPNRRSKSKSKGYVDLATLVSFLMLVFTGLIMLAYHAGKAYPETTFGYDGLFWLSAHRVSAVFTIVATTFHLCLQGSWFRKLLSGKPKNKYWMKDLTLMILFFITTLTSVIPWLVLGASRASTALLGVHNKLGLLMIVFLVVHFHDKKTLFTARLAKIN